jgi:membrane-bound lytic murein transglycosylase B
MTGGRVGARSSAARRAPGAAVVALVVALIGSLGVAGAASGAAASPARAAVAPAAVVPPGAGSIMPGIDVRLLGVPLAPAAGSDASAQLAIAQTQLAALQTQQRQLDARSHELDLRTLALTQVQQRAAADLERAQALVDRVAAAAYRGASDELLSVLPSTNALDLGRRMKLAGQVGTSLRTVARRASDARRKANRAATRTATAKVQVQQDLSGVVTQLPAATRAVQARLSQAASDLPARKVAGLGIPVAALDAYLRAERTLTLLEPACGIQWWVLAGIADGESGHGTHGGARADVHGQVFPPIVGIPLDGTNGTQPVGDTDHGLLDGDPIWDHAVGPMQFTPGTWHRWASDGNGDGVTDPQNLYDSSLAAARKLCSDAGPAGMHTDAEIAVALQPYTVTAALVRSKLARAKQYEAQGLPAPDPSVAAAIPPG